MKKYGRILLFVCLAALPLAGYASASHDPILQEILRKSSGHIFQVAPNDISISYLSMIFGSMGDVLPGGSSYIVGIMFSLLNVACTMVLATFVVLYVGQQTLYAANDGQPMSNRLSFMPLLRYTMATALLLPSSDMGYSPANILMMKLVKEGIGLADQVWVGVTNYIASTGGTIYGAELAGGGTDGTKYFDIENASIKQGINYKQDFTPVTDANQPVSAMGFYQSSLCARALYYQAESYCKNLSSTASDSNCPVTSSDFGGYLYLDIANKQYYYVYGGPIGRNDPTLGEGVDSDFYMGKCGMYQIATDNLTDQEKLYALGGVQQMANDINSGAKSWYDEAYSLCNHCATNCATDAGFKSCVSDRMDYNCSDELTNGYLTSPSSCIPSASLVGAGSDFYSLTLPGRTVTVTNTGSSDWVTQAQKEGWLSIVSNYRNMMGSTKSGSMSGSTDKDIVDFLPLTANITSSDGSKQPSMDSDGYYDPFAGFKAKNDTARVTYNGLTNDQRITNAQKNYFKYATEYIIQLGASSAAAVGQDAQTQSSLDVVLGNLLNTYYYHDPTMKSGFKVPNLIEYSGYTGYKDQVPLWISQGEVQIISSLTGINFYGSMNSVVVRKLPAANDLYDYDNYIKQKDGGACSGNAIYKPCTDSKNNYKGCWSAATAEGSKCVVEGYGILGAMSSSDKGKFVNPLWNMVWMGQGIFATSMAFFNALIVDLTNIVTSMVSSMTKDLLAIVSSIGGTMIAIAAATAPAIVGIGGVASAAIQFASSITNTIYMVKATTLKALFYAYVPMGVGLFLSAGVLGITLSITTYFMIFMVMLSTVIGFYILVAEYMIGSSLMCLAIGYPQGDDFKGLLGTQLLGYLMTIFLYPVLIVFGVVLFEMMAMPIYSLFTKTLIAMLADMLAGMSNASSATQLAMTDVLLVVVVYANIELIPLLTRPIHSIPRMTAKYLGGQAEPEGAGGGGAQSMQAIRSQSEGFSQQAGGGVGQSAQAGGAGQNIAQPDAKDAKGDKREDTSKASGD